MAGSAIVKAAFDGAHSNLRRVSHYLMGSAESADDPELRQIGGLFDVAEPVLALWRTVTGVDGAARPGGPINNNLSEIRSLLFRVEHTIGANAEGNIMDRHKSGIADTLDALINLLSLATGPKARSAAILRKEAISTYQTAQHRYALALRTRDTVVDAVRADINHERRIELARWLHRGVVDIAGGAEAWAR